MLAQALERQVNTENHSLKGAGGRARVEKLQLIDELLESQCRRAGELKSPGRSVLEGLLCFC